MENMLGLINFKAYEIDAALGILLKDRTTNKNIIFATGEYFDFGHTSQITRNVLLNPDRFFKVRPRITKTQTEKSNRTRKKAEVFTPSWICNKMNNYCDEEWFSRKNVFNTEQGNSWERTEEKIEFPEGKTWMDYVLSRHLEITCGEAPYLVSRYDASSGDYIPIDKRIGILDRKLRVINENTTTYQTWISWVYKAYESVYGYEFQGDNLLIARINLLETFCEYMIDRWGKPPYTSALKRIANIISHNIWQMDGINAVVPYSNNNCGENTDKSGTLDIDEIYSELKKEKSKPMDCIIYDWQKNETVIYKNIGRDSETMKFDFVIGNPPYQDETVSENDRKPPLYHLFMDASYEVSDIVELITPARFLFRAGQTPKQWNEKMLADKHLKVIYYESDATKIFANTDIKGGIAITLRNATKDYGEIGTFTSYVELNSIVKKITPYIINNGLNTIICSQGLYKFSECFFVEHPEAKSVIGAGTGNKIVSSVMEKLPDVFTDTATQGQPVVRFLGRINNKRTYKYILRRYLNENNSIDCYNLFIPEANNSGKYGETLTEPTIAYPGDGTADTFLSAGQFKSEDEAKNLAKYMKTKLFRGLLGVKKVTQHCPPTVWEYIPLQDFTSKSDIDWSQSIANIDKQLYKKYDLTDDEIEFIETNVKEMN